MNGSLDRFSSALRSLIEEFGAIGLTDDAMSIALRYEADALKDQDCTHGPRALHQDGWWRCMACGEKLKFDQAQAAETRARRRALKSGAE